MYSYQRKKEIIDKINEIVTKIIILFHGINPKYTFKDYNMINQLQAGRILLLHSYKYDEKAATRNCIL